jgi:hypothetical protein
MMFSRNLSPLSNDQLFRVAPSVFATEAHHTTSDKYEFLPTSVVVDALRAEGFHPVQAFQAKTRLADRREFVKHTVRFQHESVGFKEVGDSKFQILLQNSHLGSSSFQLTAGVYRLVCSNGMIVADSVLDTHRVRHSGRQATLDNVIEGTYRIVDGIENVEGQIIDWQGRQLSAPAQQAFANAALQLRWDEGQAPIEAHQLNAARRWDDRGDDLWRTMNRVQESLIRGGNRGRNASGNRTTTRAVTGLDENSRINKALWTLASEMETILKAAA